MAGSKPGVRPEALLVATPDSQQYLIYNNRRYRIPQPQVALAAGRGGDEPERAP